MRQSPCVEVEETLLQLYAQSLFLVLSFHIHHETSLIEAIMIPETDVRS